MFIYKANNLPRRKGIVTLMLSLVLLSNEAMSEKIEDNLDWHGHGNFFVTAAYINQYDFFTNKVLSVTLPDKSTFNYTPRQAYPRDFNGIRLGFGLSPDANHFFTYELFYNQVSAQSKIYEGHKFTINSKSVLGLLEYTVNPQSRLNYTFVTATSIAASDLSTNFSPSTINVDIFPGLGGKISYQLNSKFALKFAAIYFFGVSNPSVSGSLVPAVLLSYYP